MNETRPLAIPVILGTTRKGRMSHHAARLVFGELRNREGVTTELLDIAELSLPVDDAGKGIKDPRFSAAMERADAIVKVLRNGREHVPLEWKLANPPRLC